MSRPIRNREKERKALKNRTAGRISVTLRLSLFVALPLIVSFILYGFATSLAQQQQLPSGAYVVYKSKDCPDKSRSFEGTSFSFDGQEVKYGGIINGFGVGAHRLGNLKEPDYANAKLVGVSIDFGNKQIKEYPADASGTVSFSVEREQFTDSVPTVTIMTASDCQQAEDNKGEKVSVQFLALQQVDSPATTDVPNAPSYSTTNISGVKIKVAGQELTTDENGAAQAEVAPGEQIVEVFAPNDSNNRPLYKLVAASLNYLGEDGKTVLKPDLPVAPAASSVVVTIPKPKTKDNTVQLVLKRVRQVEIRITSQDCKTPDWEGLTLRVDDKNYQRNGSEEAYGGAEASELLGLYELDSGKHEITLISPNYDKAKLLEVEVWRMSPKKVRKARYLAGEQNNVKIKLPATAWDDPGKPPPRMDIYIAGNCNEEPLTDKYNFLFTRVITIQGSASVAAPDADAEKPAKVGDGIGRGYTIKTAPDSLIILEAKPGQAAEAGAENGYIITIKGSTELKMDYLMTRGGRARLKPLLKSGQISVQRVKYRPSTDDQNSQTDASVSTPTANVTDDQTTYTVSYDSTSGGTVVGVEEGEVLVTPTNPDLEPVTLAANQQVQVTEKSMSAITPYSKTGGTVGRTPLYVAVGVVGLLAFFSLFYYFRRQRRLPMQPALQPVVANLGVNAGISAPVPHPSVRQRCTNPGCGREVPDGKKFCTHCGTRINYPVNVAPANMVVQAKPSAPVGSTPSRCVNPQCGKEVPVGKKFCTSCGTRLI